MCVYSMIADHYIEKWEPRRRDPFYPHPQEPIYPQRQNEYDIERINELLKPKPPAITPEEIEEFRRLLERAREYDKRNNEPACELESKKDTLRRIAKELGVEINFL